MSGLVNGASCDVFYSRKLKNRDADLIREEGFLWKAVQDDAVARGVSPADYLNDIASRRVAYLDESFARETSWKPRCDPSSRAL